MKNISYFFRKFTSSSFRYFFLASLFLTHFNFKNLNYQNAFGQESAQFQGAGLALMFDDDFLSQWCAVRDYLKENQVKLTFFVTRPHKLDAKKLECLQGLISDGHEIGAHGLEHANPREYVAQHDLHTYMQEEVLRPMALFADLGIYPTSYAYPWGGRTVEIQKELDKYFFIQRGSSRFNKKQSWYDWNKKTFWPGSSVDLSRAEWPEIEENIRLTKAQNKVLLIYAHRITETTTQSHINLDRLKQIIQLTKQEKLPFYRFSELWFLDQFSRPSSFPGREQVYSESNEGSLSVANKLLADTWNITSRYAAIKLPSPEDLTWTEDPYQEKYWRFMFYSLRPLKNLVFAFQKTKDSKYLVKLQEILTSFMKKGMQSPYINDPHTAAFLSLSLIYQHKILLEQKLLTPYLAQTIPRALSQLAEYLQQEKNFEWNNHGVTESIALTAISMNFPQIKNAYDYFSLGRTRFLQLVAKTVDKSGVQIEQSPFYHFYTLKEFWDIHEYSKKVPLFKGSNLEKTFDEMVDFASHVVQPNGDVPLISASPYMNIHNPKDHVLEMLANQYPHLKYVLTQGKNGRAPAKSLKLFAEGGFSIFTSQPKWIPQFAERTHIVFDVGPYRTNHSQLDALSVNIFAQGLNIFPDSGLYTYEKGPLKDYYFSSAAHNLATVGQLSQSKGTAHAGTSVETDQLMYQSGHHSLYKGFTSKRGVFLLKNNLIVLIDEINPLKSHKGKDFNLFWHLHPSLTPVSSTKKGLSVDIKKEKTNFANVHFCTINDNVEGKIQLIKGQTSPRQGWYSSHYEKEVPNSVINFQQFGQNLKMATIISFNEKNNVISDCQINEDGEVTNLIIKRDQDDSRNIDIQIKNFAQADEIISVGPQD